MEDPAVPREAGPPVNRLVALGNGSWHRLKAWRIVWPMQVEGEAEGVNVRFRTHRIGVWSNSP